MQFFSIVVLQYMLGPHWGDSPQVLRSPVLWIWGVTCMVRRQLTMHDMRVWAATFWGLMQKYPWTLADQTMICKSVHNFWWIWALLDRHHLDVGWWRFHPLTFWALPVIPKAFLSFKNPSSSPDRCRHKSREAEPDNAENSDKCPVGHVKWR